MADQHVSPQLAKPDVPMGRMPDFWTHVATCWFIVLEAQFRVNRIFRQDLRLAILFVEDVAIQVSDVLLGPPSETPYDDLSDAILRRSQPEKAGCVTLLLLQQSADLRLFELLRIPKHFISILKRLLRPMHQ